MFRRRLSVAPGVIFRSTTAPTVLLYRFHQCPVEYRVLPSIQQQHQRRDASSSAQALAAPTGPSRNPMVSRLHHKAERPREEQQPLQKKQQQALHTQGGDEGLQTPNRQGPLKLNREQEAVVELAVQEKQSLFIGGSAGTGKTVTIREIIQQLRSGWDAKEVVVTATTGLAAWHIQGITFHRAFAISKDGTFHHSVKARRRMLECDAVIIDEVSMLDAALLEGFDAKLRRVRPRRQSHLPFGGVQVILCGDFLQLDCVQGTSVLHSDLFKKHFVKVALKQQMRQADPSFIKQLMLLRQGTLSYPLVQSIASQTIKRREKLLLEQETAEQRQNKQNGKEDTDADVTGSLSLADAITYLYPKNRCAITRNQRRLSMLPGVPIHYAPACLPPCLGQSTSSQTAAGSSSSGDTDEHSAGSFNSPTPPAVRWSDTFLLSVDEECLFNAERFQQAIQCMLQVAMEGKGDCTPFFHVCCYTPVGSGKCTGTVMPSGGLWKKERTGSKKRGDRQEEEGEKRCSSKSTPLAVLRVRYTVVPTNCRQGDFSSHEKASLLSELVEPSTTVLEKALNTLLLGGESSRHDETSTDSSSFAKRASRFSLTDYGVERVTVFKTTTNSLPAAPTASATSRSSNVKKKTTSQTGNSCNDLVGDPHSLALYSADDRKELEQLAGMNPLLRREFLSLKIGAKVMLRANLSPSFFNGMIGTVVGFATVDQLCAALPLFGINGTAPDLYGPVTHETVLRAYAQQAVQHGQEGEGREQQPRGDEDEYEQTVRSSTHHHCPSNHSLSNSDAHRHARHSNNGRPKKVPGCAFGSEEEHSFLQELSIHSSLPFLSSSHSSRSRLGGGKSKKIPGGTPTTTRPYELEARLATATDTQGEGGSQVSNDRDRDRDTPPGKNLAVFPVVRFEVQQQNIIAGGGGGGGNGLQQQEYSSSPTILNLNKIKRWMVPTPNGGDGQRQHQQLYCDVPVPLFSYPVGGEANTHFYRLPSLSIPLELAYAFTIHRVQGVTLTGPVHVDLSGYFPSAHIVYVAFSRVRRLEQLSVTGLRGSQVHASEDAVRLEEELRCPVNTRSASTLDRDILRQAVREGLSFEEIQSMFCYASHEELAAALEKVGSQPPPASTLSGPSPSTPEASLPVAINKSSSETNKEEEEELSQSTGAREKETEGSTLHHRKTNQTHKAKKKNKQHTETTPVVVKQEEKVEVACLSFDGARRRTKTKNKNMMNKTAGKAQTPKQQKRQSAPHFKKSIESEVFCC